MSRFVRDSRVIFDLGMNNGDDTAYYLGKGFRVLAVEANPALCEKAARRFSEAVDSGRLTIINAAIAERSGRGTFYINIENDHWSSLDAGWAFRNDSRCREITVDCVTLQELVRAYVTPLYIKIDVEGADHVVLTQLSALDRLPNYVSVEDCRFGYSYMETLAACGYDGFKLLDQSTVASLCDPRTGHIFPPGSSGPLGDDIEGGWLPYDEAVEIYARIVRDPAGNRIAPRSQWWDIHCTRLNEADDSTSADADLL